ncbi:hypothetical protein [Lonsdalea britannica]|uniref:hypothetical protein n=1 Tax=Lonsdalea britannica TaxID=1082704 RepID=UPI00111C73C5|nr:hypothetical protein [Lonsdalea britannica]
MATFAQQSDGAVTSRHNLLGRLQHFYADSDLAIADVPLPPPEGRLEDSLPRSILFDRILIYR